jgi:mono/diheme cytochrome c family protein
MSPSLHMRAFAFAAPLLCFIVSFAHVAAAGEDDTVTAARLEHKLAYLAADYAMAASSTAPSDEGENEEHAKIADEIDASVKALPLTPELAARVTRVGALVRRSAPAGEIEAAVMSAQQVLITSLRLVTAPSAPPELAHGHDLFERYCATCHGSSGRADTERAAALQPHPANFLDPSIGEPLSPYRVSTTVRFGVDGTPMVPFGFLSEADRWDLAFYVMGLRHVATPAEESPVFELAQLAFLSDKSLRVALRAAGVDEARVEPVLSDLRRRAPDASPARPSPWSAARARLGGLAWMEAASRAALWATLLLLALGLVRFLRVGTESTRPRFSRRATVAWGGLVLGAALAVSSHRAEATSAGRSSVDARPEVVRAIERSAPAAAPDRRDEADASGAPCSSPGYGPGPELRAEAGPPFVVIFNCLWPSHQRMEVSVAPTRVVKRAEVDSLLRSIWKGLVATMGRDFPETAKVCVFAPNGTISDEPLGCMRHGYEPEGDSDDEEAEVRIDMRPEGAEVAATLERTLQVGERAATASVDLKRNYVKVIYPYGGREAAAVRPSCVQTLLPLFVAAWSFYPPKSAMAALTFEGEWNGRVLLTVHIDDLATFLALDPWALRTRLDEAHVPWALGAERTEEQDALLCKELQGALTRLPDGSVARAMP